MDAAEPDFFEGTRSVIGRAVSAEVRSRMAARRLSGKGLAETLGMSQNYFATRLRDEKPFTLDDVQLIADVLAEHEEVEDFIKEAMIRQGEDISYESHQAVLNRRKESESRTAQRFAAFVDDLSLAASEHAYDPEDQLMGESD